MKFYRLEKTNYFKVWAMAILKSIGLGLMLTVAIMVILGYKFMIVSSGSMEPVMPVGSLIIVTPCDYEDLRLGDIVTMEGSGINLTHRIQGKVIDEGGTWVAIDEDDPRYNSLEAIWYTKGDNSDTVDGPLTKNIVGKVYENHIFKIVDVLVRYVKANYIMIIVLTVLLIGFVEVLNYLKGKLELEDIECYENDEE